MPRRGHPEQTPVPRVLVADHQEDRRRSIARSLRHVGFSTLEVASGAVALELAQHVDAAVIDLHLPDLSGLEVCRTLRDAMTHRLPLVLFSPTACDTRRFGGDAPCDACVPVPVDAAALASLLQAMLGLPPDDVRQ